MKKPPTPAPILWQGFAAVRIGPDGQERADISTLQSEAQEAEALARAADHRNRLAILRRQAKEYIRVAKIRVIEEVPTPPARPRRK